MEIRTKENKKLTVEQIKKLIQANQKNFSGLDLSGLDLSLADLSKTNLSYCNLYNTNLTMADLTEANLTGAILTGAKLDGADFSEATVDDSLKKIIADSKVDNFETIKWNLDNSKEPEICKYVSPKLEWGNARPLLSRVYATFGKPATFGKTGNTINVNQEKDKGRS